MRNDGYSNVPNDIENPCIPLPTSIRTKLEGLSSLSSKRCIYRVPNRLRHLNSDMYTPKVVSIGPLHHGNESLKLMEEHKRRFLRAYLRRTDKSLESYIEIVKEKEPELRRCYAEPIYFTSDELTEIMLVDAIFIIEVMLRFRGDDPMLESADQDEDDQVDHDQDEDDQLDEDDQVDHDQVEDDQGDHDQDEDDQLDDDGQDEDDPIFGGPRLFGDVAIDLQLLENQLPFFILEALFYGDRPSIIYLCLDFLTSMTGLEVTDETLNKTCSSEIKHFVHLIRGFYISSKPKAGKLENPTMRTITELHQAGVKFKVRLSNNLMDIDFFKGKLEIPKLNLSAETEPTMRNLLAFEQCHYRNKYLNDYIVFMDRLINTHRDVDLLVKGGIIKNLFGDNNEWADMINKLGHGAVASPEAFTFADVCKKLDKHCRSPLNTWKANLKQNHFNTPWAVISVVAAAFLLVLTIIQTVCSVMSVS